MNLDARLREQNILRSWRQCRRHRKPVRDCRRCPTYTATSTPELVPNDSNSAGASPLFEFLESRQPVTP